MKVNLSDEVRGAIAYQLTKRLVIDMPTARAAVEDALKEVGVGKITADTPMGKLQRHLLLRLASRPWCVSNEHGTRTFNQRYLEAANGLVLRGFAVRDVNEVYRITAEGAAWIAR